MIVYCDDCGWVIPVDTGEIRSCILKTEAEKLRRSCKGWPNRVCERCQDDASFVEELETFMIDPDRMD